MQFNPGYKTENMGMILVGQFIVFNNDQNNVDVVNYN